MSDKLTCRQNVEVYYRVKSHEFIRRQKWACRLGWHQRSYRLHTDRSHPVYSLDPDVIAWEVCCFRCDWKAEGLHVW